MTGLRGAEGDAVATRLRVERLLAIVRGSDPQDASAPSLPLIVGALTPTEVAQAMALAPVAIIAVGVGSPLVGDAASGGDLDELARRARSFRAAVEEAAWSRS